MRFHVVGLPHTVTGQSQYSGCAFTGNVARFCRMMSSLGHTVYHYGAEESEAPAAEQVTVLTAEEQCGFFGEPDPEKLHSVKWDTAEPYWQLFNRRAAEEIARREERGDFLCLIGGDCQKPIADAVGRVKSIPVEYAIGYWGTFAPFRVFPSYTHQAAVYARARHDPDGCLYDAVIPHYFDPEEFPLGTKKNGTLLFLARVIRRKGIQIAVDTARAAGLRLVVAGPGVIEQDIHRFVLENGDQIAATDEEVECVGYANPAARARLMGEAQAILQPTLYMEPFGQCVVEANLCGTPAITTDYGAFAETVRHGVNGYRCHTLEQFAWAAHAAKELDPWKIRRLAVANYSIDRVRHMYQEYFEMLSGLWREGWPELRERAQLDWLTKAA